MKGVTESTSVTSTSADASADLVYTVPQNYDAVVEFALFSNGAATDQLVYLQRYNNEDSAYETIVLAMTVIANSVTQLYPTKIYLKQGDTLRAYKDGGTISVTISAQEFFRPNKQT